MANYETLHLVKELSQCVKFLVADMHGENKNSLIPVKFAEAFALKTKLELYLLLKPEDSHGLLDSVLRNFGSLYIDLCEALQLSSDNLSWVEGSYRNFKDACELAITALERTP